MSEPDYEYAAAPLTQAYRMLFGYDGSTVDEAVEAAYTPTGPTREAIRKRIEFRRTHPDRLHEGPDGGA